jgi:hypothetical protein
MQSPIALVRHKVLAQQEREKKKKSLDPCLEQRKHFTPFVISADGLLGRKAAKLLKRLLLHLTINGNDFTQLCAAS